MLNNRAKPVTIYARTTMAPTCAAIGRIMKTAASP